MTLQKSISCSLGPDSVVGEKGEKEKSRERKNSGERVVIFYAFLHCGAKIFEIMGLVGMSRKTKIKMFIAKNQPFGANW